jgi:hypothetical protein
MAKVFYPCFWELELIWQVRGTQKLEGLSFRSLCSLQTNLGGEDSQEVRAIEEFWAIL